MTQQELLDALAEILQVDQGTLERSTVLEELRTWDSMSVLEFQALADESLGMQVDPSDITDCKTVGDLCKLVKVEADA